MLYPRVEPSAMDQKIINLFDSFTHGGMSRRVFLDRLRQAAGSAAATSAMLTVLENDYARAAMVEEDDPRLRSGMQEIDDGVGGYLSFPLAGQGLPAVLVIHENRGLNPHIRDVTRCLALEGFIAFAPDYLYAMGGTPDDADKARDMIGQLKPEDVLAVSERSFKAITKFPLNHKQVVGAVGFCWGGGHVNRLAVAEPKLKAAVAYYGTQPPAADVPKIQAPLLLHYAGLDQRVNAGIPDFEAALKANGKTYEIYVYEGANHAFNNDTNAARYDKEAATLAWGRTVAFLKKYLG
jgi:carboxymethylenebutenolidase